MEMAQALSDTPRARHHFFFLLGAFMSIAMERLMELVLSGQFCDITVVCRGNEGSQGLPMSRLVLAAVCPAVKVTNAQVELQARQRYW